MRNKVMALCISAFALTFICQEAPQAGEKEDMEEMQKQLNKNVLERPFNPGDKASIDAYLEEAIKKNTPPPQQQPPMNWQPGWTCNNLMYSYYQYRNCLHYYRYYGHYYGY
ncbi:hypothetical protein [Petrachloros mirabilis]